MSQHVPSYSHTLEWRLRKIKLDAAFDSNRTVPSKFQTHICYWQRLRRSVLHNHCQLATPRWSDRNASKFWAALCLSEDELAPVEEQSIDVCNYRAPADAADGSLLQPVVSNYSHSESDGGNGAAVDGSAETVDGGLTNELSTYHQEPLFGVPWTLSQAVQVSVLWLVAYVAVSRLQQLAVELWTGVPLSTLSALGRALYHFIHDCLITALTVLLLFINLRKYMPLAKHLFRFQLHPWRSWSLVVLCCASFPLLNWMSLQAQDWFPVDGEEEMDLEEVIASGDLATRGLYFALLSILAPVWEELVFRGFVLPSLSRYLPVPWAILTSAVIFALAHNSLQKSLGLILVGVMLGAVYCRSRNLLHPIVLHSLWNFSIFYQLTCHSF